VAAVRPADQRDAAVAARAAVRAVALGAAADARDWLRPSGTAWANWSATTATRWRWRCSMPHPASARLAAAAGSRARCAWPRSAVVAAVGMAFADRQLWGKARKLLEQAAPCR
jgi:HemY protein